MQLLTLVIALGFLQVWGAENPLHKDAWFHTWISRFEKFSFLTTLSRISSLITVGSVILPLALLMYWLLGPETWWGGLHLPLSVVILLYSLGRGEFSEIVAEYTKACYVEDWPSALERARPLGVLVDDLNENDWSRLHERVLEEASYRGFERMFSVLFWFLFFGPLGALFYRLLFLYSEHKPGDGVAGRLLWTLEWVPVRFLGLSFSFTGNFVGSWGRWRESLFCMDSSSRLVLSRIVLGALSVSEDLAQSCEVTRKELNMVSRLYTRTLWFWLGAIALFSLLN